MNVATVLRRALLCVLFSISCISLPALANDEADARAFADRFVKAWFVEQDIPKALTMVDEAPVLEKWVRKIYEVPADIPVNGREWAAKFLVAYLYHDHGYITELAGHADPQAPGYGKVPIRIEDIPLDARIAQPEREKAKIIDFAGVQNPKISADFMAVGSVAHNPREQVIIFLQKKNGTLKVVGLMPT